MLKSFLYRPEAMLVTTFAALIAAGTVLLCLPVAHTTAPISFDDALFTATSAVCVTGLITVDTATAYSPFGQTVILILIQLGGLGIMTFGALAAQVLHRRISFVSQAAWRGTFFETNSRADLRRALGRIVLMTIVIETLGATLLYAGMGTAHAPPRNAFDAVFHAVSAFCNAGFSIHSKNAVVYAGSPLILITLMFLIIAGGLGYSVLFEIFGRTWKRLRHRPQRTVLMSLQSRIVLYVSGLLIGIGALVLFLVGFEEAEDSIAARVSHAVFQSVTARTAGFNTVDIGALPVPMLLVLIALMFIGGSPGSCAGGIKTTTAAVWFARVRSRLLGREDVALWGRQIPHDVVRRAALVISIAALWNLAGIMLLSFTEHVHPDVRFDHLVFEQISAFATVGLSAGITPGLSLIGKLWIIATMFVGRLGPLTVALAVLSRPRQLHRYPPERVMIG